jgi:hypothetical protein
VKKKKEEDEEKKKKMGGPCGMYGELEKYRQRFGMFILNKRNQFTNRKVRWESYNITVEPEQIGWDGL